MAFRSEQTRVLRRTIWWRTVAAYAIYTVVFILLAVAFNTFVSPRIGDYIADSTSSWRYFTDEPYKAKSTDALLRDFLERQGNGPESWMAFPDEYLDSESLTALLTEGDANLTSYMIKTDQDTGLVLSSDIEDVTTGEAARLDEDTVDNEAMDATEPAPPDEAVLGTLVAINHADGTITLIPYSRQYLADRLLTRDYLDASSGADSWIQSGNTVMRDGSGALIHAFYARDLGPYKSFRELKFPLLILAYFIGGFIILFVSIGLFSKDFDALAGGIASVFEDKTKSVQLPPSLSIAQGELNNIRLQSLSDERAAQAAESRKNELVVYMAHDIRTPLTSIIGYLSLLDEAPDLPAEVRQRYIATTERKAEHLERLVEEFFEITKYNLQAIPIERRTVQVRLFFEQLADEFYPQAAAKGLSIQIHAPEGKEFFIDADKLARALGNIMRNAISYADPDTTIAIRVEEMGHDAAPELTNGRTSRWRISITDQGREIAPEHLESIFEKFYREDGSRGTEKGGTGLGLAIAKEIIVSHSGTVHATSENGSTTFTVEI